MLNIYNTIYERRAKYYFNHIKNIIGENKTIIDLGAGSGYISKLLSNNNKIILVDIKDYNKTDLPLLIYDGYNLPYENNIFDYGLIVAVLHHTENPQKFLKECQRVTKNLIIIEETYKNNIDKKIMVSWEYICNRTTHIDTHYNFKTNSEWINIFNELNYNIIQNTYMPSLLGFLNMSIFQLEK